MRRRMLLLSLLLLSLFIPHPASAAAPERLFAETGWRVRGRLLEYWTASGGLPVFGFPIGPAVETTTAEGKYLAQNFERERLELHPELQAPYDVLL